MAGGERGKMYVYRWRAKIRCQQNRSGLKAHGILPLGSILHACHFKPGKGLRQANGKGQMPIIVSPSDIGGEDGHSFESAGNNEASNMVGGFR